MNIKEARTKYPELKVSHLPKADYLEGISESKIRFGPPNKRDETYLAEDKDGKHWLLYPDRDWKTGSFKTRAEAAAWFRNGGR